MRDLIIQGDALTVARSLPDQSVHMIVTSPPYYGLRDYGSATWTGGDPDCSHSPGRPGDAAKSTLGGSTSTQGHTKEGYKGDTCPKCSARRVDQQMGLEETPQAYVDRMVELFAELRRVLRDDGTLWLNLGDSYSNGGRSTRDADGKNPAREMDTRPDDGLKPKDLIGIPWRVALALQADGWTLRSDIIWHKPNPMPESVTDRPGKAHEYLFLLSKSPRYYYDHEAIKAPAQIWSGNAGKWTRSGIVKDHVIPGQSAAQHRPGRDENASAATRNKRSVWTVATRPYAAAHFATYPPALIEPCILAGTSARGVCPDCGAPWARTTEREFTGEYNASEAQKQQTRANTMTGWIDRVTLGRTDEITTTTTGWAPTCACGNPATIPAIVYDPFMGSGTTAATAISLGRSYLGSELNPAYIDLARQRIAAEQPALFAPDIAGHPAQREEAAPIEIPERQIALI